MALSDFRADRHPADDVGGATSARPGSPPITQITFLASVLSTPVARYLRYETDDFLIDLRLEHEEVQRIAVCGQIESKLIGQASSPEIGVLLTGNNARLLRHTIVNSLGEFKLQVEKQRSLALYVQFEDSTITHIDLPRF